MIGGALGRFACRHIYDRVGSVVSPARRKEPGKTVKRLAPILTLLALVVLMAAGCATTGSSAYPKVDVGGYSQFRYTTFHGGTR